MIENSIKIISLLPEHWPQVKDIYEKGIASGNATFQTTAPEWEEWHSNHVKSCRLAAIKDNVLKGWAALSRVSARPVYAGVAEVSIYIHPDAQNQGVGSLLLERLTADSEQQFWTLQAGIFPENIASIRLHEKHGFRLVGRREKIGKMNGLWRDTLLLERRSNAIFQ